LDYVKKKADYTEKQMKELKKDDSNRLQEQDRLFVENENYKEQLATIY